MSILNWQTTEEINSKVFEIERSQDAKAWRKIGIISSHGESNVIRKYEFADVSPLKGSNYYRIKMVDKDDTFTYSRIEFAGFERSQGVIFPNPSSHKLFFTHHEEVQELIIHNPAGLKILESHKILPEGVDISQLPEGMYIVTLTLFDGTKSTHKVIVTK